MDRPRHFGAHCVYRMRPRVRQPIVELDGQRRIGGGERIKSRGRIAPQYTSATHRLRGCNRMTSAFVPAPCSNVCAVTHGRGGNVPRAPAASTTSCAMRR